MNVVRAVYGFGWGCACLEQHETFSSDGFQGVPFSTFGSEQHDGGEIVHVSRLREKKKTEEEDLPRKRVRKGGNASFLFLSRARH